MKRPQPRELAINRKPYTDGRVLNITFVTERAKEWILKEARLFGVLDHRDTSNECTLRISDSFDRYEVFEYLQEGFKEFVGKL